MAKRVFVSFNCPEDEAIKNAFIAQWDFDELDVDAIDYSLKEAAPQPQWKAEASRKIKNSSVVVILGPNTKNASGVGYEVYEAARYGKLIHQFYPMGETYHGRWEWAVPVPDVYCHCIHVPYGLYWVHSCDHYTVDDWTQPKVERRLK